VRAGAIRDSSGDEDEVLESLAGAMRAQFRFGPTAELLPSFSSFLLLGTSRWCLLFCMEVTGATLPLYQLVASPNINGTVSVLAQCSDAFAHLPSRAMVSVLSVVLAAVMLF
jgi:hypothetical protein